MNPVTVSETEHYLVIVIAKAGMAGAVARPPEQLTGDQILPAIAPTSVTPTSVTPTQPVVSNPNATGPGSLNWRAGDPVAPEVRNPNDANFLNDVLSGKA